MNGKKYYVSANTAKGFIHLLPSNTASFEHTIILNHSSEKLKTLVFKKLIERLEQKHSLEILLSPLGDKYLDGFILREKGIAVVGNQLADESLDEVVELNLSYFIDLKMEPNVTLKEKHKELTELAYDSFSTGLKIHDELEKIYISEMDFSSADKVADDLIEQLFNGRTIQAEKDPHVYKRLFGTNTPEGAVNVVPEIIQSISSVYYLKGRAGTGKSTFMRRIAAACEDRGLSMEKYYCSFDPGSLDMIHVPALDFAIFDSTDPHEFFPSRTGEKIIDLYKEAVTPGTDEKFAAEIKETTTRYKSYMKDGIQHLREAKSYLDTFEDQFQFTEKEVNNIETFITENFLKS